MGADTLYGRSPSVRGSYADVHSAIPGDGTYGHTNSPVYQLAGTAMGNQAAVEPVCGYAAYQTLVDTEHATAHRRCAGRGSPYAAHSVLAAGQPCLVYAGGIQQCYA